ncbi:bifunctional tetrahydrofolate synthase/dihydrofolate synthase [Candidatus Colwellia aromaticivorans]|uniref:bifunctional tetrahydrofolate synthase/dihydrofolate synthase n=1 Tax=Candidatus Colwellia aromaticivorans TaxID=2267621 RepID=UPI000DF1A05F|nr:bifunctional tetrahydrofolate synthase/dihydrofolate synthase [Candidatus Colwellia aromaticivorans]
MPQNTSSHSKGCKDLNEWLCYLETLHNAEIDLGLSRIGQVAKRLNINFDFARVITVAGTNGKGTTCSFLENALLEEIINEQALTVAVYSSPHIERFNERLRINKTDVDDQSFITAFEQIELARAEISLSYYEFTTLAAFIILMAKKPNIIILEVGLGGRLDATNIIDADVAVVTTIDLDHQTYLGNDRETIGFEKAGIFRANQHIIIGDSHAPNSVIEYAEKVNHSIANVLTKEVRNKIKVREQDFTIVEQNIGKNQGLWQWQYTDVNSTGINDETIYFEGLISTHIPRDNVATALMVLTQLGVTLTTDKINALIAKTKVAGRTELLINNSVDDSDVMLDVGHNPHAGRYLAKKLVQLKKQNQYQKVIAVVAMLADKDINNTLQPFHDVIDDWYIAQLTVPRAASVEIMTAELASFTNSINCFDNITQAFKIANKKAQSTDLILVFGSFYTVAEIRRLLV